MIRIREATCDDGDEVFSLACDLATSFDVEKLAFSAAFQQVLSDDHARLLVAVDSKEVVGYCLGFEHSTFFANGRVAWVEEIAVSFTHRKKGVGRSLMTAFERWAVRRAAKLVALATRRAAGFYRALGYEASATYFRKPL